VLYDLSSIGPCCCRWPWVTFKGHFLIDAACINYEHCYNDWKSSVSYYCTFTTAVLLKVITAHVRIRFINSANTSESVSQSYEYRPLIGSGVCRLASLLTFSDLRTITTISVRVALFTSPRHAADCVSWQREARKWEGRETASKEMSMTLHGQLMTASALFPVIVVASVSFDACTAAAAVDDVDDDDDVLQTQDESNSSECCGGCVAGRTCCRDSRRPPSRQRMSILFRLWCRLDGYLPALYRLLL